MPVRLAAVDELTDLLLEARDGDRDAFEAAVRLAEADVRRLVRCLASGCDAEDVAQDAFVRAWNALPRFRAEGSGRSWLLGIARRACVDAVRDAQRRRRLLQRASSRAARSVPVRDCADIVVLQAALDDLDPDRHEAFVLTQVIGLSYEEAARVCGVPIGTIRSRVARARDQLATSYRTG
jgi:RNA polymerase sigma-70 factor (ECF subfamily)